MTSVINLTPHEIILLVGDIEHRFPPSGNLCKVSTAQVDTGRKISGGKVFQVTAGEVTGLPQPVADTYYLVSAMAGSVLCKHRPDVLCPDTGEGAVRNEKGQIIATKGFVTY